MTMRLRKTQDGKTVGEPMRNSIRKMFDWSPDESLLAMVFPDGKATIVDVTRGNAHLRFTKGRPR